MTFGEKLIRLRKGQGLSQEALAEALGVSRQAVSRWEQGTALPDAGKLLPCARLFQVSVDWLLDDGRNWEERETEPAKPPRRRWPWYLAGGVTAGVGALGMVVMGILSAAFPASVSESPAGVEWSHVYTGLTGFLKFHGLGWLFALWAAMVLAGLCLLAQPAVLKHDGRRRQDPRLVRYAAGQAAALYSCGQAAWWVQWGNHEALIPLGLLLTLAVFCTVRLFQLPKAQGDAPCRRRDRGLVLLETAAQAVIVLLMAGSGAGLAGPVLHIGFFVLWCRLMAIQPSNP